MSRKVWIKLPATEIKVFSPTSLKVAMIYTHSIIATGVEHKRSASKSLNNTHNKSDGDMRASKSVCQDGERTSFVKFESSGTPDTGPIQIYLSSISDLELYPMCHRSP